MPSIKFDIGVETSKLDEELKKANQSFSEFEKAAVKSGQGVDKAYKETGKALGDFASLSVKEMKESVDIQKRYIQDLQQKLKELQNQAQQASGTKKSGLQDQSLGLRKDIVAEQGAQLEMSRQLKIAQDAEGESQGGLIGSLGKWALGLATVTTALHVAKSVIESTEGTAKQFEYAVEGAKSGLDYFWKTLATGDFSNFFTNMSEAIRLGHDYAQTMHEIKEMGWAQSMKESGIMLKNTENEIKLRNTDLPKAERLKAGEERIKDEETLSKGRIEIAEKELTAVMKIAEGRGKFGDTTFNAKDRTSWDKNKLLNQLGQKVPGMTDEDAAKLREKVAAVVETEVFAGSAKAMFDPKKRNAAFQEVYDFKKNATAAEKELYDTMKGYGNLKEGMITNVVNAYNKVGQADNSAVAGLKRVFTTVSGVTKQIKEDEAAAAKKAKEDAELDNRIKATQELMRQKAVITNAVDARELGQLAAKLAALEREKKKREELLKLVMSPFSATPMKSVTDGVNPSNQAEILTGFVGSISKSTGADVKGDQYEIDRAKLKMKLSDEVYQKEQQNEEWIQKRKEENAKKQKKVTLELLDAVFKLTMQIGEKLGMTQEQGQLLGSAMDSAMNFAKKGFKNLVSGDWISAAVGLLSGVISMIPTHAQKFQSQIEDINRLLEEQQRLIDKAARYGGEETARKGEIKALEDKRKALEAEQTRLENKKGFLGLFTGKKQLGEVNDELQKLQLEIEDADLAMKDFLSGGVTENTLADSIAEGFKEGKTSVNDFADYMNTVLLDAVMNIFKGDILADMQPLMEKVRASLGDKKLTNEEKDAITLEAKRVADENQSLWKDLTSSIDLTGGAAKQTGMVGTIQRSITEETGTEWVGLTRRLADDARGIRDFTKLGLNNLMAIEANTGETVAQLKRAVTELQSIVTNTKPAYSGKL